MLYLSGSKAVSIDLNEFKQGWDYGDSDAQKEHNFRQMDSNKNGALTEIDLITVFATADKNASKSDTLIFQIKHTEVFVNSKNLS